MNIVNHLTPNLLKNLKVDTSQDVCLVSVKVTIFGNRSDCVNHV